MRANGLSWATISRQINDLTGVRLSPAEAEKIAQRAFREAEGSIWTEARQQVSMSRARLEQITERVMPLILEGSAPVLDAVRVQLEVEKRLAGLLGLDKIQTSDKAGELMDKLAGFLTRPAPPGLLGPKDDVLVVHQDEVARVPLGGIDDVEGAAGVEDEAADGVLAEDALVE